MITRAFFKLILLKCLIIKLLYMNDITRYYIEISSKKDFSSLYSIEACSVAVVYIIYDKKRKI